MDASRIQCDSMRLNIERRNKTTKKDTKKKTYSRKSRQAKVHSHSEAKTQTKMVRAKIDILQIFLFALSLCVRCNENSTDTRELNRIFVGSSFIVCETNRQNLSNAMRKVKVMNASRWLSASGNDERWRVLFFSVFLRRSHVMFHSKAVGTALLFYSAKFCLKF